MRSIIMVLCTCLLAACSSGRDFARPTADTVAIGVSNERDLGVHFGEPSSRKGGIAPKPSPEQIAAVKSPFDPMPVEGSFVRLEYEYSTSDGLGERDFKNLFFILWNDKVVAYDYVSDMKDMSTRFDESHIASLQRGITTRQQVIELLGAPSGEAVYPLVRDKGIRQFNYSYIGIGRSGFYTGERDIELSFLEILIGPDDKVLDFRSHAETKTITPAPAPSAPFMSIFIPPIFIPAN